MSYPRQVLYFPAAGGVHRGVAERETPKGRIAVQIADAPGPWHVLTKPERLADATGVICFPLHCRCCNVRAVVEVPPAECDDRLYERARQVHHEASPRCDAVQVTLRSAPIGARLELDRG